MSWSDLVTLTGGALLSALVWNRTPVAAAAWIAPAFLLYSIHDLALANVIGLAVALYVATLIGYRGVIPVPPLLYPVLALALIAPAWLACVGGTWLGGGLSGPAGTLAVPVTWTVVEYLCSRLHPYGTWGSLAYTQTRNSALVQLAAVTGIHGVSFMIVWAGATLSSIWRHRTDSAFVVTALLAYGLTLAAVLLKPAHLLSPTRRRLLSCGPPPLRAIAECSSWLGSRP